MDLDQFLQRLMEGFDASPECSSTRGVEEKPAFLHDWFPPTSLRDWIGLARSEDNVVTLDDQDGRIQRTHGKHVDR
jgi:hypothetical protein